MIGELQETDQDSRIQAETMQRREGLVKAIVDALFPDRTIEEYYELKAKQSEIPVEKLTQEAKNAADLQQRKDKLKKESLIEKIVQTDISNENLAEYVASLFELANLIPSFSEKASLSEIRSWVNVCDTTERIRFYISLINNWQIKFMTDVDPKIRKQRLSDLKILFTNVTRVNISNVRVLMNIQIMGEMFTAFEELYNYIYSIGDKRAMDDADEFFKIGAEKAGLDFNDPNQTRLMLQLYRQVADYPDREIAVSFAKAVYFYAKTHGLSEQKVIGLVSGLLPAMQKKDFQIKALMNSVEGNIWGMQMGNFGIGDYLCHAYASPVNSANLNELFLVARGVPATTLSRLEQNRTDARIMSGPFNILRDFIHDQRPYVHEVLEAMVHYYDTGDRSKLERILPKADYFNSAQRIEMMFNRSNYEALVEEPTNRGVNIKAIDILRRLVKNTEPVPDFVPVTSDESLNQRLKVLEQKLLGAGKVSKEALISAVDYLNQKLITMMTDGDIGIEPNLIMAISWIERRAFEVLQRMSYEDQVGAYKQEWFISLLKFEELIGSIQYDEEKFQSFVQNLADVGSPLEAYKLIGNHVLQNIQDLIAIYKQRGRTDFGALWSGNLAHELMGLIDFKPAKTALGKKFREEDTRKIIEPGYHPGD